jgi:regulator of RNase E activity RraA
MNVTLSHEQLNQLRKYDTCTLSNAIERLNLRPRNEGFVAGSVVCRFPGLAPVIGYAVTAKMRASMPPIRGRCYYEHAGYWKYLVKVPAPRIIVMQDVDDPPGAGALLGEAYARIGRALGCVACLTNGAVRDVPAIETLGFQLFAGSVSVSHAYAHVVEFGEPVEIEGLKISSGDLLHGDLHGVHLIPSGAAGCLADVAEQVLQRDRALAQLTDRKDFSVDLLAGKLEEGGNRHLCDWE